LTIPKDLWTVAVPYWDIILRTAVIYAFLLVGIRITGKRELGQLSMFDFVLLLVISNAVQNAMNGGDSSLGGGLVSAVTLFGLNAAVSRIAQRSRAARRLIEGEPTVIVHSGQIQRINAAREGITEDEVMAALREHGLETLDQVGLAVLECDGSISVIPAGTLTGHDGPAAATLSGKRARHSVRFLKAKH